MIYAFWFLCAIAVGIWADKRGRSGFGWFVLSVLISPLLGAIFLAVTKNLAAPDQAGPTDLTHARCPACAEHVLPQAKVCKHCGSALTPDPSFEERRIAAFQDGQRAEARKQLIVAGTLIALVIGAYLVAR